MRSVRTAAWLGAAALTLALVHREAVAVKPLDKTQQFMYGDFVTASGAPTTGPLPARLAALPRDTAPLPPRVWLRFQNFGGSKRFPGHAVQMMIDVDGNLFVVTQLGKATAASVTQPKWPKQPTQVIDAAVMARLRKAAQALTSAPAYTGHANQDKAPTFVLTLLEADGRQHEHIFEAWQDDLIEHLRRITSFAYTTPLKKPRKR